MGNESVPKELVFFLSPDAEDIFAELDYTLKNGVHIQRTQEKLFDFVSENISSLKAFYSKYYELNFDSFGENTEKVYFLDFFKQSRNNRQGLQGQYEFLDNQYVLVGFLIFKIQFIDKNLENLELNSVNELKKLIRKIDYSGLKEDILRTLALSSRTRQQEGDDNKIDGVIEKALNEFKQLGWITLNGDFFETLPAFHRIHHVYQDEINRYFDNKQEG